jgi:hypothetical protein
MARGMSVRMPQPSPSLLMSPERWAIFLQGVDGLDDIGVRGAAAFVHEGDDGAGVAFFNEQGLCIHDGSPVIG